ncbi:MAG: MBL fold metallo-hydrolase [Methanoregulaceae archaeon]|nr:MBL fold metallo-hydrolase [Methanoregulaceae archaeon]
MKLRYTRLICVLILLMLSFVLVSAGTIGVPLPKAPGGDYSSDYQGPILSQKLFPTVRPQSPYHTRLVLLGTTGGVGWWPGTDRASSSSALLVGDTIYLIDMGQGSALRLSEALNAGDFVKVNGSRVENGSSTFLANARALFITHLHMDHTADYPSFLLIGSGAGLGTMYDPVTGKLLVPPFQVYGPASRGPLEVDKTNYTGKIVYVDSADPALEIPTPGMRQQTASTLESYAQAINDMTLDNGYRDYTSLVEVHEIGPDPGQPGDIRFEAPGLDLTNETCASMEPFDVYEDGNVRVRAILVDHHQVYPSLAYRFDTADGSVVFSGDTGNNTRGNLQKLAAGADILVHEVIDPAWINLKFGNVTGRPKLAALKIHMQTSHTTIEDAGAVATRCGVKTLVLNHIVPGNTPRSNLLRAQRTFPGKLIIGEDLMVIPVGRPTGGIPV